MGWQIFILLGQDVKINKIEQRLSVIYHVREE